MSRIYRPVLHPVTVALTVALLSVSVTQAQTMPDGECALPGKDGSPATLAGVVNTYYPGTASAAAGARCITVGTATGAATAVAAGDLLLVIQMQRATINSTDSTNYGDGAANTPGGVTTNLTSGNYEFVEALGAVGASGGVGCGASQIPIQGRGTGAGLLNDYTNAARAGSTGRSTFQVVRVPQYVQATLSGNLQPSYWNGTTGGILAIDTIGRTNLNGFTMNASGRGFRGGGGRGLGGDGGASATAFRSNVALNAHGAKGEGIAGTTRYVYNQETGVLVDTTGGDEGYNNGGAARGAPGNAGGGGTDSNPSANDENAGGGGGANGGNGGIGGNAWNSNAVTGGYGGGAFAPGATPVNRIVLGGGGGAGARNNSAGVQSSGGAGGGIILIQTGEFRGTGSLLANGAQGPAPDNDGAGGGGSGGTIVIRDNQSLTASDASGITITASGAAGSNAWATSAPGAAPTGNRHGPGGGGGGGRILRGPSMTTGTRTVAGGAAGTTTTDLSTYGAAPGSIGTDAEFSTTPPGMRPGFECAPLPVTLAYVEIRTEHAGLVAHWSTASEYQSVGFRWFGDEAATLALDTTLTPSERGNSTEPTAYQTSLSASSSGQYWLAEFDIRGHRSMHGPYRPGQPVGMSPGSQAINWSSAQRQSQRVRTSNDPVGAAKVWVSSRGFQRVSYEHLQAAGIDFGSVGLNTIAVTRNGAAVERRIRSADEVFGPGDQIEFFAEPWQSLYGKEAVYRIELLPAKALAIGTDRSVPGQSSPAWVWGDASYAPERAYNFASPTEDPWYADRLLAYQGVPASKDVSLTVNAVADVSIPATLTVDLVGATNHAGQAMDHDVRLRVDGAAVAQLGADGLVPIRLEHPFSLAANRQTVAVGIDATGATPYPFDVMNLDRVQLRYPRLAVADSGRWLGESVQFAAVANDPATAPPEAGVLPLLSDGFENAGPPQSTPSLKVRGLDAGNVSAYVRRNGQWQWMSEVRTIADDNSWNAFVPGIQTGDDVFVATDAGFAAPRITAAPVAIDLESGSAEYLVISHASFIDSLSPLLQRRQSQGLSTAVVDVARLYDQYGAGEADPEAIRRYIAKAQAHRGTRYVLLVGGDTYDYRNDLGVGSISFVPSLYRATSEIVRFAPLDAAFADTDSDGVQDLAIGRLPVRTSAELETLISKILLTEATAHPQRDLYLVSGGSDPGVSFSAMNDEFADVLPAGWTRSRAAIDEIGLSATRADLLNRWRQSPAAISFVGHSAPGQWTYDPLLTGADIAQLAGTPAIPIVLQWGCWNTYYVSPTANSLAQTLLLQGSHGAAAVFGAVALTDISGHRRLAPQTFAQLQPGQRVGDVILNARQNLASQGLRFVEPMLGSNLLGDPAMVLP